jgi:hypothetical protein
MPGKMTPSAALTANLNELPAYLRTPIQAQLLAAAGRVRDATDAYIIGTLMGSGAFYGVDVPTSLHFPLDHRLHPTMGTEWYWLTCNLEVDGSGGQDRIAVLVLIFRSRAVSLAVQERAGWSDIEAQIVDSLATVTVTTRSDSFIARRRRNTQWPAMGGVVEFGGDPFLYRCGPDVLSGPQDVLPLNCHIDDGDNMKIDLTFSTGLKPESAFYLQGTNGVVGEPDPGFYYSWPQLDVKGSVSAGGKTYAVSGKGWVDHELSMSSIAMPAAPTPPLPPAPQPGWKPLQTFNGWSFCAFNFDNGDAMAVSAFQKGTLRDRLTVPMGKYVRLAADGSGWERFDLSGTLDLDRFVPGLEDILMPTDWTYRLTDQLTGGSFVDITVLAVPWYPDGSFFVGNLMIESEVPVSLAVTDRAPQNTSSGRGKAFTGVGYCESVSYQPVETYIALALAYLNA